MLEKDLQSIYYKYKYEKSLEINQTLTNTLVALEEIPLLFSYNKIKPNKSKNVCITNQHGSLSAKAVLVLVSKQKEEAAVKQQQKYLAKQKKDKEKKFYKC